MKLTKLVIAVDMDGTMLFADNRFHPLDVAFLKQDLPLTVIFATGRSLTGMRLPLTINGLIGESEPVPYPLVLHNGALVYLPGQRVHRHFAFEPGIAAELVQRVLAFPQDLAVVAQGEGREWLIRTSPYGGPRAIYYGYRPLAWQPGEALPVFSKLLCISDQPEVLKELEETLRSLPLEGNSSLGDLYEMTPKGVTKATGLNALLPALGVEDVPLITVGDGENDFTMLDMADLACAPANAHPPLKTHAQFIFDRSERGIFQPVLEAAMERLPLPEAVQGQLRAVMFTSG
ncbi:HAD family hydrolase [Bellilinea sp.]|uniref:HAD family hydrolase n=1 Tax=Bellilinea sp. TaxID=2838785 RepID=UPI002ADDDFFA|nr:HAD family hydrolase [Bellilinea sp.]